MMFTGQLFGVSTSTGLARRVAHRRLSQVLLALLSLSTVTGTATYAATIQSLRGERRIVLYSAPNDHDDRLIRQQDVLAKWQGAAERDVTGIQIVGSSVRGVDDSAADLRQRYHLPNDGFAVVEALGALRDWGSEFRVVWPDGSIHWLVAKGNIYGTTDSGQASRMLGIVMDITDRKRTEAALAASEELARGQVLALTKTIDSLTKESAPDRLLEHVLSTIIEQLKGSSIGLWRRDETTGLLHFESSNEAGRLITRSDPSLRVDHSILPLDEFWPWTKIFHSGEARVIEDIRDLPEFPWRAQLLASGVITMLAIPMSAGGRVVGALRIRSTTKRSFASQEIELAQALVNQAMLSIQLTKLSAQSRDAAVIAERTEWRATSTIRWRKDSLASLFSWRQRPTRKGAA